MAYDELCMYCFEDREGEDICPHCGHDVRAAVPQIQMLPGSLVYHERFLVGRALGQDSEGIVYNAYDTRKGNKMRLREYLPRGIADRSIGGDVQPVAGQETAFEEGKRRLRAAVEGAADGKKPFYFEENGTAYVAQRKAAAAAKAAAPETEDDDEPDEDDRRGMKAKIALVIAVIVLVGAMAAFVIIRSLGGVVDNGTDLPSPEMATNVPTVDPNSVWMPLETPTPTPYTVATFAPLVDPEQSWLDYTYEGNVEQEYQQQVNATRTATPKPVAATMPPVQNGVSDKTDTQTVRSLQERLVTLGWLNYSNITGKYDDATKQAVRDFQTYVNKNLNPAKKLTVDGIAGKKTLQWLYGDNAAKPTAAPTQFVTAAPNGSNIDQNSPRGEIKLVQQKLIALGLLGKGKDDGVYGNTTVSAVKNFQTRVNLLQGYDALPVTGVVDAQTFAYLDFYVDWWTAMKQATAAPTMSATATPEPVPTEIPDKPEDDITVDKNSPKESIKAVQKALIEIGMLDGKADGVFGKKTENAIKAFQSWVNMRYGPDLVEVSGVCDSLTLSYLEDAVSSGTRPLETQAPEATVAPTAEITAVPTDAPTEEPTAVPTSDVPDETPVPTPKVVNENSTKSDIREMQAMLINVGLLQKADGINGKGTRNAVSAFQQFVNDVTGAEVLAVTGVCDETTYTYLEQYSEAGMSAAPTPKPVTLTMKVNGSDSEEVNVFTGGNCEFSWDCDANLNRWNVTVTDANGNVFKQWLNYKGTYGYVPASDVVPGMVYTVTIEGNVSDQQTVSISREFMLAAAEQTEAPVVEAPTEVPAAEVPTEAPVIEQPTEEPYIEQPTEAPVVEFSTEAPTEAPTEVPAASLTETYIGINGALSTSYTELTGETVEFQWTANGTAENYTVVLEDSEGSHEQVKNGTQTSQSFSVSAFKPGEIYTLRVGALPVGASEDERVWASTTFGITLVATAEPTAEPTPAVGSVGNVLITVNGVQTAEVVTVETDDVNFGWTATGDVESYDVLITDQFGNIILDRKAVPNTSGHYSASEVSSGVVYTVTIGARPVNGTDDDVVYATARFVFPIAATPEPAPTPEVGHVSAPQINIGGTAYSQDGMPYLTGETAIFSWTAEGEVAGYTVYVENGSGQNFNIGNTTDTSYTVDLGRLGSGVYRIYVGAVPKNAQSEADTVWTSYSFGIPSAEPTEAPVITEAPVENEPVQSEPGWPSTLSTQSSAEEIQTVQMKLYQLGKLPNNATPGELDDVTRQSIASFQTYMNEVYDLGLAVIDPANADVFIDQPTLDVLYRATVDMFS